MAKKTIRRMTYEESKQTIYPYKTLPSTKKCIKHDYKLSQDTTGHSWLQCNKCGTVK